LQATPEGTGRPDELAAALGLDPAAVKIKRTKLIFLDNYSPVIASAAKQSPTRHNEIASARKDAPRNDD
jgi:hypothetical protein